MKLLVFSPYYPPHIGGLESHADEFNKYLSLKGIDITVFTPRLPREAPESEIRYNNVRIIRFPAFEIINNYPLPKLWSLKFWQLYIALLEEKFDIIISRTRFFNTSLLALIYAKIKKTKWIHIEHGSDFVQLSSPSKTAIARWYDLTFGKLILKKSDLNISISRVVQGFVNKFDQRDSPIIYRGLNFDEIDKVAPDFEVKEKYKDKIIISFVGRLYKWKGVENSILVIKSLPEDLKGKIVFLIIGDGEDFAHLQKISEKEKEIVMLGNLSREKALGILKISDIYLHSAEPGGGLSTALLEAMYCECAVIATPNEGAKEIINDNENGLLIETSDSKLISKKIIELVINKEKRESLSQNAPQKILAFFTWDKSIKKYLSVLKK